MLAFSALSTSVWVWERLPTALPETGKHPINTSARVGAEVLDKETPRYSRLRILWCVFIQLLHLKVDFWISANCHGRKSALSARLCSNQPSQRSWIRELPERALELQAGHRGRQWHSGCCSELGPKPHARTSASPGLTPPWKRPELPRAPPSRSRPVPPSRARGARSRQAASDIGSLPGGAEPAALRVGRPFHGATGPPARALPSPRAAERPTGEGRALPGNGGRSAAWPPLHRQSLRSFRPPRALDGRERPRRPTVARREGSSGPPSPPSPPSAASRPGGRDLRSSAISTGRPR